MKNEDISIINDKLDWLEKKMKADEKARREVINILPDSQQYGAKNLVHYLSLRSEDIKELQNELHELGLSSLASSESHIHRQLQSIRQRLGTKYLALDLNPCTYQWCKKNLKEKSTLLFGKKESIDSPYIMVTFDATFADNYALIKNLLLNGMNVARINCAHDNEAIWAGMIHLLQKACHKTGKSCKIYMDLAGPKIRTSIINKGKDKGSVKVTEGQMVWLAYSNEGFSKEEIVISPNEPDILRFLSKGDRVFIDDGIIHGVVEKIKKNRIGVRLTRISSDNKKIKDEKGINFPDTDLKIPSLTAFDISCLPFICDQADMIGYSFVRHQNDVSRLRHLIWETSEKHPSIVIKIETPEAVINLPDILLEGMKDDVFGIMIARGDLAVEIGFERMGEIQEEILWICEAAHVPVIWATQVLENLNKSGLATRSEITDAGHAALADCVMINKGPHTIEVIETLQDILKRTAEHRNKKRFLFRQLNIAKRFIESPPAESAQNN